MTGYHPLDEPRGPVPKPPVLLSVDLGLRSGLAYYAADGRLLTYRSTNFGSAARLKRAIPGIWRPSLRYLVTEGDARLAHIWEQLALRRSATCRRVDALTWRRWLYSDSEMKQRGHWKDLASRYAMRIIHWSEASQPTSLRHDAAEAICIGLYAASEFELISGLPAGLRS